MKTLLSIASMMPYLPPAIKDAVHATAKAAGAKTDDLELHRHSHSEKAQINQLDPKSRKALKYVSYRTQDRDDEIVIPESLDLTQFKKYRHVLCNHNYSTLPIGSDDTIEADDYGIKALTTYADTGEGTLANICWHLVSQGHMKSSSIGFVPTSFTKPGARDWDHVANQLQTHWPEFSKSKAEKSVSRIITGGVLLEHSDVSVPCNVDAELISVVKAMKPTDSIIKQLGWEMKDGILVNKTEAEKVPSVCDECGYVADTVPGSKCPECKTGDMKAKGKEKAIEISDKGGPGSGNFGHEGRPGERGGSGGGSGGKENVSGNESSASSSERMLLSRHLSRTADRLRRVASEEDSDKELSSMYKRDADKYSKIADLVSGGKIEDARRVFNSMDTAATDEVVTGTRGARLLRQTIRDVLDLDIKSFHSRAVEKPNPHMPGGSFSACVLIMEDKGHDSESAKKICGALQADAGGKGLTEAEAKAVEEITGVRKAMGICTCDECGAEDECAPGSPCQEADCEGVMRASKKMEKEYAPVVMVVKPAPQIKVLYVPPDADLIAKGVSDAVEKTLARRTGRIL